MQRTPDQLREAIKRHQQLQKNWAAEAVEARAKGLPMFAAGCDDAVTNHKRSEMIAKTELEAMR